MRDPFSYRELGGGLLFGIAVLLFALASCVHILCGDFPKTIDVMPDEMRYLDTARSLFAGEGLVMRGEASSFQKILYPLALFPALLFPDAQEQVRMMGILNSLYACSSVFPALLIARRLFRNPAPIIACMAFTLILPDLMYSMTFMTESVFIPLSLWLVYVCWRGMQSRGFAEQALALGAGALCYLVYLCKEVAWMYLIAFLACYLAAGVRKRKSPQRCTMAIGLFVIGFLGPFVLMKLTLFSGLLNSYAQFSFDILLSPYTVLFGLYSLVTDGVYFIVGFGVFPILYLACLYPDMRRQDKDLFLYCAISLAIGLAVVVFTISMREDVGHAALRQHLRYVIPLFLPLLFLFIREVAQVDPGRLRASPRRLAVLAGVMVGFCALVAGFFGSANLRQGFDNSQYHFMRWLLELAQPLPQEYFDGWAATMSGIDTSDGDLLVIHPLNWVFRFLVVAFTAVGTALLLARSQRMRLGAGATVCAVLAVLMLANSAAAFQYNRGAYGADQADIDEICEIDAQLAARGEPGQVIVVIDEKNTKSNNLVDTYVQDGLGNYRYLKPDQLSARLNVDDEGADALAAVPEEPVRYLLLNTRQGVEFVSGELEQVGGSGGEFGDGRFILYRAEGDEHPRVLVTE